MICFKPAASNKKKRQARRNFKKEAANTRLSCDCDTSFLPPRTLFSSAFYIMRLMETQFLIMPLRASTSLLSTAAERQHSNVPPERLKLTVTSLLAPPPNTDIFQVLKGFPRCRYPKSRPKRLNTADRDCSYCSILPSNLFGVRTRSISISHRFYTCTSYLTP